MDSARPPTAGRGTTERSDAVISTGSSAPPRAPQAARTLLPSPIAQAVSFATRSTSLAIRVSSVFGSYGLDAAKFTTLSSLELARGVVEGVLTRAGRDVALRPQSDLAAADAENVLERSLEGLHHAVSQVVFWTSASFQLTGTTLLAASDLSQLVLSSLDQLFGSTDSSRAMASIITLIRREFNNPATGGREEKVGVMDLVLALSALAYLQQRCRKSLEKERQMHEEVIWDVVVLSDGERVDVPGDDSGDSHNRKPRIRSGHQSDDESVLSISTRRSQGHGMEDDELIVSRLKHQIASSLSPGTTVAVANSVSSVQTITVDVRGPEPLALPTPPGAEIVETRKLPASKSTSHPQHRDGDTSYRVVYKIHRNKMRSTLLQRDDEDSSPTLVELDSHEPNRRRDSIFDDSTLSGNSSPTLPAIEIDPDTPSQQPHKSERAQVSPRLPLSNASRNEDMKKEIVGSDTEAKAIPSLRTSSMVTEKLGQENAANQKKQRSPPRRPLSRSNLAKLRQESETVKKPSARKKQEAVAQTKGTDKRPGFKQVLKDGSQSISNMLNRDAGNTINTSSLTKPRPQWKTPGSGRSNTAAAQAKPSIVQKPKTQLSRPNSRLYPDPDSIPRSSSRASYVSIHERRRDSIVSQADAYTIRGGGGIRPASPTIMRTEVTTSETFPRPPSAQSLVPPSPSRSHRRGASYGPSIYSLATNDSQTSLVLASYFQKSAYSASDALSTLRNAGAVEGTFPSAHLLKNISRYMRFSSASYGSKFLKVMGISNDMPSLRAWDETHDDVRHFVHHTESGQDNILLASFVDPNGGSDSTGSTETGVPLVHYISLDHGAKAVVLACRGTLGFEDVLADLTCEYDVLQWRGHRHKVHKGILASARRILYGGDGRVLVTLQEALREFPEYGLVFCGHSLGGSVTALLGLMLSEPNPTGTGFVTASEPQGKMLTNESNKNVKLDGIRLPPGRPIHVFAYGPPGVMSSRLCQLTKGLITTVVHGSDIVPHMSLGLLHDFQAVALTFQKDEQKTKTEIRQRLWGAFQHNVADKLYGSNESSLASDDDELGWMQPALESLKASMKNERLMPPGEVFTIETQRVLRRDAFLLTSEDDFGRPARRVVLKYVRDVAARFREVKFGTSMLTDHSPAKYEEAIQRLRLGVAD